MLVYNTPQTNCTERLHVDVGNKKIGHAKRDIFTFPTITDPKVYYYFIIFVSMMYVYRPTHVSMHVRVCILLNVNFVSDM